MAPPVSSACLAEIHRQLSERRGALGQAAKDLERGVAEGQHGSRRPMIELLGFIVAAYDMLGAEFHVTKVRAIVPRAGRPMDTLCAGGMCLHICVCVCVCHSHSHTLTHTHSL